MSTSNSSGFSLSFSMPKILQDKSKLFEDDSNKPTKQLIQSIDDLHEKPKDDLVIPLVDNTLEVNYRNLHPELSFDNSSQNNTNDSAPVAIDESKPMTVEERARYNLMHNIDDATEKKITAIPLTEIQDKSNVPLLKRNRIPGLSDTANEEEKYKKHLELLPDELDPQSEAYDKVPIDLIGAALLRGMGWKEGMGVGLNCKEPAKIQETKVRVAGLGLGAKPAPDLKLGKMKYKMGEEIDKGFRLKYEQDSLVGIKSGKYKGYCGKITRVINVNNNNNNNNSNNYGISKEYKYEVELEDFDVRDVYNKSELQLLHNPNYILEFKNNYPIKEKLRNRSRSRSKSRSRSRSGKRSSRHHYHSHHHHNSHH